MCFNYLSTLKSTLCDLKYCDVSRIGSPDWLEVMPLAIGYHLKYIPPPQKGKTSLSLASLVERAQTHSGHDNRDSRYIDIKYVRHKSRMRMRGDSKLQAKSSRLASKLPFILSKPP